MYNSIKDNSARLSLDDQQKLSGKLLNLRRLLHKFCRRQGQNSLHDGLLVRRQSRECFGNSLDNEIKQTDSILRRQDGRKQKPYAHAQGERVQQEADENRNIKTIC
jgi:hypothetical protein